MNTDIAIGIRADFPVLDYDNISLIKIEEDILHLIEKYKLDESIIFETKKGFRVAFPFDLMEKDKAIEIIKTSKYVDQRYVFMMQCLHMISCRLAGKYIPADMRFLKFFPDIVGKSFNETKLTIIEKLKKRYGQKMYSDARITTILLMISLINIDLPEIHIIRDDQND